MDYTPEYERLFANQFEHAIATDPKLAVQSWTETHVELQKTKDALLQAFDELQRLRKAARELMQSVRDLKDRVHALSFETIMPLLKAEDKGKYIQPS